MKYISEQLRTNTTCIHKRVILHIQNKAINVKFQETENWRKFDFILLWLQLEIELLSQVVHFLRAGQLIIESVDSISRDGPDTP